MDGIIVSLKSKLEGLCKGVLTKVMKMDVEEPVNLSVKDCRKFDFDLLPPELKHYILQYLKGSDVRSARLVCNEWCAIIDNYYGFNVEIRDKSYKVYRDMRRSAKINMLCVQELYETVLTQSISRCGLDKNVKHLILSGGSGSMESGNDPFVKYPFTLGWKDSAESFYDVLRNLRQENSSCGITEDNLKMLLRMHANICWLTVSRRALSLVKSSKWLGNLNLNMLTALHIHYGSFVSNQQKSNYSRITPYIKLLSNFFPCLHSFFFSSTCWKADFKLYLAVLELLGRHSATLKKVKIYHNTIYSLSDTAEAILSPEYYQIIRRGMLSLDLQYLLWDMVKVGPNPGDRWKLIEMEFLESQKHLVDLRFIARPRVSMPLDFNRLASNLSNTLQRLEIFSSTSDPIRFDCFHLKPCVNLKHLKISINWPLVNARVIDSMVDNVDLLPPNLTSFACLGVFNWRSLQRLVRTLINLERISFSLRLGHEECRMIKDHFYYLLQLPKLQVFSLENYFHDEICTYAQITPGLRHIFNGQGTMVLIDRRVFRPSRLYLIDDRIVPVNH